MPFPLPGSKIADTESALGLRFPLGYLARLRRDNGGEVVWKDEVWWLFPFRDNSDRKRLSRTCNDVIRETRLARERPGFPSDAVAIAHDGGGDHLIFVPDPADPSRLLDAVYRWGHETAEAELIAGTFEELERGR